VRILFAALHNGDYRNLDSVVDALARRGHDLYLGAERPDTGFGGPPIVESLTATHPNVTCGPVPPREPESLFLASKVRLGGDYLRYLHPRYPRTSGLLPMARERTPTGIVRLCRLRALDNEPVRGAMRRALDAIDRAVAPSPAIEAFLDARRPDLVVITPLIGLAATSQPDLLRAALARRIPTAVIVWSWDNLSSKAIIRDVPDALLVWNETQRWEATALHAVPPERVVVTGAQNLDRWFGRAPSRTRAEFARAAGLDDRRPYVMWVCSALLPSSPPEPQIVLRWLDRIRGSTDSGVRDVAILIRPHPARTHEWDDVDWRRFGNITMFGTVPADEASRTDFFDSMYYAGAVVGITTTAFLDAAVVGRPVLSFHDPDLRFEHEDSLHFQYLLKAEGGLLTMGASLEEHIQQLGAMLAGPQPAVMERQWHFVQQFVRPGGMDAPATPAVVAALEGLKSRGSLQPPAAAFSRLALRMLAAAEKHPRWRTLVLDEREVEIAARQDEKARRRAEALARKAAQRTEKARRVAERAKRRRR
jgi:hypothetical protein